MRTSSSTSGSGDPLRLKTFGRVPNVGDALSPLIAARVFARPIVPCGDEPQRVPNLVLLGSILHWADAQSHVCGAGLLSPQTRLRRAPRAVHAVRGPLTARALRDFGIGCPPVFGDPGVLAPDLFPFRGDADVPVGIVPHYVDASSPWLARCRALGWPVLDVRAPVEVFMRELQRCEVVMSSSLHGIVFAHAYGRRALWVEMSQRVHGDGFKFFDYYASLGIPAERVARCRVADDGDPRPLVARADVADQRPLRRALAGAFEEARHALAVI